MKKQRILIVDDSAFVRRMLQDWISQEPDMEVVGVAVNGKEGIDKANELKPDLVTLDVEMPVMSGLESLPGIIKSGAKVLMVSSVTQSGAAATMQALEAGAVDFVTKPNNGSSLKFVETKLKILEKIRSSRYVRGSIVEKPVVKPRPISISTNKVVVIASSTGGPKTLRALFDGLPEGFSAPILIVQHMPAGFTASLASRLDQCGTVRCREAKHGDKIEPSLALLAPGGKHMVVEKDGTVSLNEAPPIHGVRPAADYLFESASQCFGSNTVGVVLTGMGRDGASGAVAVKQAGGMTFGESEETCVIYGMPKAAKQAGGIDSEFPLHEMPSAIVASLSKKVSRAS